MFMGEVIEPPQQPKEWEVLVLAKEDVNEAKINLGCQIQESERLTEEGLSIVDGEQRSDFTENDLNHKATAMQLPEHVIEAGALFRQDQEERDLELALSLQQQEVEERRAWVVALAGGQQQHCR